MELLKFWILQYFPFFSLFVWPLCWFPILTARNSSVNMNNRRGAEKEQLLENRKFSAGDAQKTELDSCCISEFADVGAGVVTGPADEQELRLRLRVFAVACPNPDDTPTGCISTVTQKGYDKTFYLFKYSYRCLTVTQKPKSKSFICYKTRGISTFLKSKLHRKKKRLSYFALYRCHFYRCISHFYCPCPDMPDELRFIHKALLENNTTTAPGLKHSLHQQKHMKLQ